MRKVNLLWKLRSKSAKLEDTGSDAMSNNVQVRELSRMCAVVGIEHSLANIVHTWLMHGNIILLAGQQKSEGIAKLKAGEFVRCANCFAYGRFGLKAAGYN